MNVVITGVSRGIGYHLAVQFARAGHQVVGISRDRRRLLELEQSEAGFTAVALDLSEGDYSELDQAITDWLSVDVVINNAGALVNKPFEHWTAEDLHWVYGVNVFAPFQLLQHLFPRLQASNGAHVVNISSMGGFQGAAKFPGLSGYSSSKAAIANLSECLAEEWKEVKIAVNALALGAVQTEMLAEAFPGFAAPVQAEEMAEYIFSFALEGHKYFNGKVLPVSSTTP